jgi:hypothetical protein
MKLVLVVGFYLAQILLVVKSTAVPSEIPTRLPTRMPSEIPTRNPSNDPTITPTKDPTFVPTRLPTTTPTEIPTRNPSEVPTKRPSADPTFMPTRSPTASPTTTPTKDPTFAPTRVPSTEMPTRIPTPSPSRVPTRTPTFVPTALPTVNVELPHIYSQWQSCQPYWTTNTATATKSVLKCIFSLCNQDSVLASLCISDNTDFIDCTGSTVLRVYDPDALQVGYVDAGCNWCQQIRYTRQAEGCGNYTIAEGCWSTASCSGTVGVFITPVPTRTPTRPPTVRPTKLPTATPSWAPSRTPSEIPTKGPSVDPTMGPTRGPSEIPTWTPTRSPSELPTRNPSTTPTMIPSRSPSELPTRPPTRSPTVIPTRFPTFLPGSPTPPPTRVPTNPPTGYNPTLTPSASSMPSIPAPTISPTIAITVVPSRLPTRSPSVNPTESPTQTPTGYEGLIVYSPVVGTSADDTFVIEATSSVTLSGNGGNNKYVIGVHPNAVYIVTDFSRGNNFLDVSKFPTLTSPEAIEESISRTPDVAVVTVANNQKIILTNLNMSFALNADHFLFADPAPEPKKADSLLELLKVVLSSGVGVIASVLLFLFRTQIAFSILRNFAHPVRLHDGVTDINHQDNNGSSPDLIIYLGDNNVLMVKSCSKDLHQRLPGREEHEGIPNELYEDLRSHLLVASPLELDECDKMFICKAVLQKQIIEPTKILCCIDSYPELGYFKGTIYALTSNIYREAYEKNLSSKFRRKLTKAETHLGGPPLQYNHGRHFINYAPTAPTMDVHDPSTDTNNGVIDIPQAELVRI